MGRFLFKLAIISILCFLAYLLLRFVIKTVKEDYSDGRFDRFTQTIDRTLDQADYSAEVTDLTIEHNQTRDGEIGMYVYSTQTWRNLKGINCYSILRFFDDEGKPLRNNKFQNEDGEFCMTGGLVPDNKKCINDQRIFVPYSEFEIPDAGTTHFLCDIRLYIINNEGELVELAYSKPSRFHITSN